MLKDYHRICSDTILSDSMSSQFLVLVRVLVHGVVLVLGDVLEVDVSVLVLQKLGQLLQCHSCFSNY